LSKKLWRIRNILADQAFNTFSAFPEGALKLIKPEEVKKAGKVPTNCRIFCNEYVRE
jgi:type I restriction enzyme R subunit